MKTATALAGLIILVARMALDCHAKEGSDFWGSINNPQTLAQLKLFVAAKEAQAYAAAKVDEKGMPLEYEAFFDAANKGDWLTVSNGFWEMGRQNGGLEEIYTNNVDMTFRGTRWETVKEIWGAFDAFAHGDEKYSELFGNEIIPSIPAGSIYFGGTDPGRFIITALQKSQINAEPFFTLTQNALVDGSYLDYLRSMYGNRIYIPTSEDLQKCFNDFYSDLKKRYKKNQLKPGEDVTVNSNGVLQASGKIAIMEINALIAKIIFDKETNRNFYVDEYVPLDWMYPYLEPHGLIFKLNREQLAEIPDDVVQHDHDYWVKMTSPMIGDWLNDDTLLRDVAAFVKRVFLRHDLEGFQGDPTFEKNAYTQEMFRKERVAIAGLYAWRAEHSDDAAEKKRMQREADFGFRQAWAMDPDSTEVVLRYVQFLTDTSRPDDAILVARTCVELAPHSNLASDLLKNLEKYKKQCDDWAAYQNQVTAMEKEAQMHPSNYTNISWLADSYMHMHETNRAVELWKQTISSPNTPEGVLGWAADFFAQMNDFTNLETALEKLTITSPDVPETRYNLARVDAHLGKNEEAITNLRTAIDLSDQRLKSNPKALNIRDYARANTIDFDPIRNTHEFKKLLGP